MTTPTAPTTEPTPRPMMLSASGGSVLRRTIQLVVGFGLVIFLL